MTMDGPASVYYSLISIVVTHTALHYLQPTTYILIAKIIRSSGSSNTTKIRILGDMGYSVTDISHFSPRPNTVLLYGSVKLGITSFPNTYTVAAAVVLTRRRQGDHSTGALGSR